MVRNPQAQVQSTSRQAKVLRPGYALYKTAKRLRGHIMAAIPLPPQSHSMERAQPPRPTWAKYGGSADSFDGENLGVREYMYYYAFLTWIGSGIDEVEIFSKSIQN